MKCPGCGYASYDLLETCKRCGAPMVAGAVATGGGSCREGLDHDAIEVGQDDLDGAFAAIPASAADDAIPPFRIDDDLFVQPAADAPPVPDEPAAFFRLADQSAPGDRRPAADTELPGPAYALVGAEPDAAAGAEPLVDRYDEVPERYWAPEVAGLGRRALALLVDQSLLTAVLATFFLGTYLALRLSAVDTGLFLSASGLQASALPFALLATLLSLAYYVFFHTATSRTPGKALVGIEVRDGVDDGALTWRRALLRWLGAVLGLACAGVGIFWAIFEPRRRGWADLISGTVLARPRRDADSG